MIHEPVDYNYLWFFIIGAVFLCGVLFLTAPKLMRFLDSWTDGRNKKGEKLTDDKE